MRIGVVTVHDSSNYGAFLQAFALKEVLKDMGHQVCFIRTRDKTYIQKRFYHLRPSKRDIRHPYVFIRRYLSGYQKYKLFQKEWEYFDVVETYIDKQNDMVILGSDEIWNVGTPVFRKDIFYGVGMKNVMAYAVSIGTAEKADLEKLPKKRFEQINPILARDSRTADFLKNIDITDVPVVCDPTLLVDISILKREYQNNYLDRNHFILIYSYTLEEYLFKEIKRFAEKNELKTVSVCFYHPGCDYNFNCSPLEFCTVLEKADYVFTTTFHGAILSILSHKQFISIPVSPKTTDILCRLGLQDRGLSKTDITDKILNTYFIEKKIDYLTVDSRIKDFRNLSLGQLKRGIELYEPKEK